MDIIPNTPPPAAPETYWDPAGPPVAADAFATQTVRLQAKLQKLQAHPFSLKRNLGLLALLAIIGIAIIFIIYTYGSFLDSHGADSKGSPFSALFLPIMPVVSYFFYIKKLQKDLVCCLFAQSRNWLYNPDVSKEHWSALSTFFPALFNKGNMWSQYVEDEFWGSVKIDDVEYTFWKAPFVYQTGSGKHKKTHTQDAMAFHLPKTFKATVALTPEGWALFGEPRDDVKTESVEFNRAFTIRCPGMDDAKKLDVLHALSPAVQTRLLDLKTKRGNYSMQLQRDVIVFCFECYASPIRYTNFFKKVELDPRDTEALEKDLREILSVTGDLLKYMD